MNKPICNREARLIYAFLPKFLILVRVISFARTAIPSRFVMPSLGRASFPKWLRGASLLSRCKALANADARVL
jgi:hypothetical protein